MSGNCASTLNTFILTNSITELESFQLITKYFRVFRTDQKPTYVPLWTWQCHGCYVFLRTYSLSVLRKKQILRWVRINIEPFNPNILPIYNLDWHAQYILTLKCTVCKKLRFSPVVPVLFSNNNELVVQISICAKFLHYARNVMQASTPILSHVHTLNRTLNKRLIQIESCSQLIHYSCTIDSVTDCLEVKKEHA